VLTAKGPAGRGTPWNWGKDLPYFCNRDPHGTRHQRVDAFGQGYNTGNTSQCLSRYWPTGF
jgi:hypothetical protein